MAKYWSATEAAFYDTDIISESSLPEDSVLIPDDEYAELMARQCGGCVIVNGAGGRPAAMQQICHPCTCITHEETKATDSVLGHVTLSDSTSSRSGQGDGIAATPAAVNTLRYFADENKFSINSLGSAFNYGLFWLCIEIFDDTADVNTSVGAGGSIADYYDATNHLIIKTGTDAIVLQSKAKTCTKNNDVAWVSVDYEGSGSVDVEISRDGGTTFTACVNNLINDISIQPAGTSMICRLTLNGEVTLKNVAWGCK